MDNENEENIDSTNDTEGTEETNEETVESTESKETDLEAEVKKATASLYARMKKAEQEAKEAKDKLSQSGGSKQEPNGLAQKDVIYLAKTDIHEDDMDEVVKHAQTYKISVREAHEYLKPILAVKQEQRTTANATNTRNTRAGSSKVNPSDLLAKARSGAVVDDMEALAQAQFEEKKARTRK